jgi:hypothetical protein
MDENTTTHSLSKSLVDEIFNSMGESGKLWSRQILKPLIWLASTRFARMATAIDGEIERAGFQQGMRSLLPNFISGYETRGVETVPPEGPLLVVSNHPGTVDSLLIAASLPRDDLKIFATGFSFLKQLPATRQHLIFSSRDAADRMMALRRAIRQLQEGAALLIFPSGNIDPDPAVLPGAERHLSFWSPSVELMLKKVPDAQVLVTIVSGVLSQKWMDSPIMRLWKDQLARQSVAGTAQVIRQLVFPTRLNVTPKVSFATPLVWDQLQRYAAINKLDEIIASARQLLSTHTREWGIDNNPQPTPQIS